LIRIFIGYDENEPVAFHVLVHSILKRASVPVSITPLNRTNLKDCYWRPRGELDSTDFSSSRWIVPHLCNYEGTAIFMDCDVLCRGDIKDLWDNRPVELNAVNVVQHHHVPTEDTKFLGVEQTRYSRKNWSSVMIFDNDRCRMLTKHIVNTMSSPLWFHQFQWVDESQIGALDTRFNHLVGYSKELDDVLLAHFSMGGPWYGHNDSVFAPEWWTEYDDMVQGENPINYLEIRNGTNAGQRRTEQFTSTKYRP